MKIQIHSVVVIGAGTMGAAIAAHLANAGIPVHLLDIIPPNTLAEDRHARNAIVWAGFERVKKSKPASFFSTDGYSLVNTGNLEDDFDVVSQADWIIEVILENLQAKQALMARIDAVRKPGAIVSSNTSGIPLKDISAGRSEDFKKNFLGTHFFNPPRYLKLLEIIPTTATSPEVVEFLSAFGEQRLGKGVVLCKDTPNFIGNRFAFGTGAFALHYILKHGYTVDEVDALTGPLMGRPRTATFRLIDLVGIDVWNYVGQNLASGVPHDTCIAPYLQDEKVQALISAMLGKGWLGNKTKSGFYKEVKAGGGKEFWSLDFQTLEHVAPQKVRFESIGRVREIESLGDRLKNILSETDRGAQFVRALLLQGFQYASYIIPEVAETGKPIDDAIRWGFGHEAGPFEIWDMLGVAEMVGLMNAEGFTPANWVNDMLAEGCQHFYKTENGRKTGFYNPASHSYTLIRPPAGFVILKEQKIISQNIGATLRDIGDGVACVEFHTKMNALDDDIFNILIEALDRVETDFEGLVIGNSAENFSAGANLFVVAVAAQQRMWDTLDDAVRKLQNLNMRMRYFHKPVIMAPTGMALGGGAELIMHGSRSIAHAELYMGLVETGAGVIPAGGGTKEILRRLVNPAMRIKDVQALPFLQHAFEQIALAKVSGSADEARQFGFLSQVDRVVMNRGQVLHEAKKEVLYMAEAGFSAPIKEKIFAAGRDALAALQVGVYMMAEAKFITEYEKVIAGKLAHVLAGGEISQPQWVSEQYILDLEREAFLSLCGNEKTQQRMWHLLKTGKPLRN